MVSTTVVIIVNTPAQGQVPIQAELSGRVGQSARPQRVRTKLGDLLCEKFDSLNAVAENDGLIDLHEEEGKWQVVGEFQIDAEYTEAFKQVPT